MATPHFIQVGGVPVFAGAGGSDLNCRCGQSVLIKGYLPANFLAIRIKCFRCGEITETPGLSAGEILPHWASTIAPQELPAVTPSPVPRGAVLACAVITARSYELTRPRAAPDLPLVLSRALVEAAASEYDKLTGGRLAEQVAASRQASGSDLGDYPFAWSVQRLRERIDKPDWSWLYHDDDAVAAIHVVAMHNLVQCWGHHPLFARLAACVGEPRRFLRTLSTFAMAKLAYDAGNRVGFSENLELRFITAADKPLSLALLDPAVLQWRERERRSPEVLRTAVIDALSAEQGKVNRSKPGMVVLSVSIWQPDFDQMLLDAIRAVLQSAGRRHRGVAAVAAIMPKGVPVGPPDQIGFGYAFYPILNPRFVGENPVGLGPAPMSTRAN